MNWIRLNIKKKLQELINIYGADCIYCKQVNANTIDHIIPQSSGWGKSSLQNMLPACKECNSKKRSNDIFTYITSEHVQLIDAIRLDHGLSSLINLKEQYLAWKDINMGNSIFAIKLLQTGKVVGAKESTLYSRLRILIGLYFVMIGNQEFEHAKSLLTTLFTSNEYDDIYPQNISANQENISFYVKNKKLVDIVEMLKEIYRGYTGNTVTKTNNSLIPAADNLLEQIIAKYDESKEQADDNIDLQSSLTYLNDTLADIAQVSGIVKKLRHLEKERITIESQILNYQRIKSKIEEEYNQIISDLEEQNGNELMLAIVNKLKVIHS